jgi:S1-C subfamily serine protease
VQVCDLEVVSTAYSSTSEMNSRIDCSIFGLTFVNWMPVASGPDAIGTERDDESSIGAWFFGRPSVRHDGVGVSGVQQGGTANEAGIEADDVILSIDGDYVYTINDLHAELLSRSRDSQIGIKYRRSSLTYQTSINLRSSKPQTQR